jgi:hypothetical protein
MKALVGTLLVTVGMNLWFASQISQHWPQNKPGRLIMNLHWFNRPGVASVFTRNLRNFHECKTSAAVTIIWMKEFIGSAKQYVLKQRNYGISSHIEFFSQILLLRKEGSPYFRILKNEYEEHDYEEFSERIVDICDKT